MENAPEPAAKLAAKTLDDLDWPENPDEIGKFFSMLPNSLMERLFDLYDDAVAERGRFLANEGVAGVLLEDRRAHDGLLAAEAAGSFKSTETMAPPTFVITAEQYDRVARAVEKKQPIEVRLNLKASISSTDSDGENIIGDMGGAQAIYNVIDSRQADPQANVIEALRGLGYTEAAEHYVHFSYEMVALTPRCAIELGYQISQEDRARPYIEVSGRKGFGVKADALLDKLTDAAKEEVDSRHPQREQEERQDIAHQIAVGALRYFMLKFARNTVIAFDFKEALSFEGETGPYVQYAIVRARNIFRKAGTTPEAALVDVKVGDYLEGEGAAGLWELWIMASRLSLLLEQCIAAAEPAYLARHAFQLAQLFNNFYHRHHILTEEDPRRQAVFAGDRGGCRAGIGAVVGVAGD